MVQHNPLVIKFNPQAGTFDVFSWGVYLGTAGSYLEAETLHEQPALALRRVGLGPLAPSDVDRAYDAACAAYERGEIANLFQHDGYMQALRRAA